MRWFNRRGRYAGIDFLDLVPQRAVAAEDPGAPESVVLLMPRFLGTYYYGMLQRFLKGRKRHIRIPLEERGSFLWRSIDGKRDIRSLVAAFVARFPGESEAAERVCRYLHEMEQHRFVRFLNLPR